MPYAFYLHGGGDVHIHAYDNEHEFINCLLRNIWSNDSSYKVSARELYDFVVLKVNKYKNKSINEVLELSSDGF